MKRIYKILVSVYGFTGIYAITRYHIYGPVLWKDLPLFTLNKILIFSAIIFLVLQNIIGLTRQEKQLLQKLVLLSVASHVVLSLLVLKPYYLKNFFDGTSFTFSANISLLFGSLTAAIMLFKTPYQFATNKLIIVLWAFITLHLVAMGWHGWIHPHTWYGGMPPITLLSFWAVLMLFIKQRISK